MSDQRRSTARHYREIAEKVRQLARIMREGWRM
jgi:hypothetical protein